MSPVSSDTQAAAYDEIPYDSFPFHYSHPARAAAAAALFGLPAPDLRTARVLELGCAAGGNLIPHAAYYPQAQFLGIDVSGRQIAEGRARIATLGLTNITLRLGSLSELSSADGEFDFIISHGVYSWVPPEVREALLRVSAQNLKPHGLAYISYNIYPGWHMKKVVRDLMLFRTIGITDRRERVEISRSILAEVRALSTGPYHEVLSQEHEQLEGLGDYYIGHEHLEEENHPCYFADFISAAERHGLAFLAEADIPATLPEAYAPKMALAVRKASRGEWINLQQYLDFYLGRSFRMSIMVRAEQAEAINYHINPQRLAGLSLLITHAPLVKQWPAENGAAIESFDSSFVEYRNSMDRILVHTPGTVRALDFLAGLRGPQNGSCTVEELIAQTALTDEPTAEHEREISSLLIELFRRRMISFFSVPLRWAGVSERPKAYPMIANDAKHGQELSVTISHEPISFAYPVTRVLLELLDGTRTHAELAAALAPQVASGTLVLESHVADFSTIVDPLEAATRYVAVTLQNFSKLRLLES